MLFHNEPLFLQCRMGKLGQWRPKGGVELLRQAIEDELGVSLVFIVRDTIDLGPHKGRDRICLYADTDAQKSLIDTDQAHQHIRLTTERFLGSTNPHVFAGSFQDEAMNRAAGEMREKDSSRIVAAYRKSNVWQITGMDRQTIVFFMNESDVISAKTSGLSTAICTDLLNAVASFDEFGYFNQDNISVHFDSKEKLDRDYEGSMFHYFR